MAHKDHLLHSRRRKDWLHRAQSMPLARLLLVARKFEMMARSLIDRGHECLSDCGRVLDHALDSDFDSGLDSDPDSDPGHHSASMARRHAHYFLHSRGNEPAAAESYGLHIAASQLSGGLRKAPSHSGLHEDRVHYTISDTRYL